MKKITQFIFHFIDSEIKKDPAKNYWWHIWKGRWLLDSPFGIFARGTYYNEWWLKMQKKPEFWVVPWAAQGIEAHHSDGSGRIFWFFGFWSLPPSLFFHIWLVFEKNWFGTLNSGQFFYPKWISVHTVNIMYWNNLGISKLTRIHFKCMYYISSIQERNV